MHDNTQCKNCCSQRDSINISHIKLQQLADPSQLFKSGMLKRRFTVVIEIVELCDRVFFANTVIRQKHSFESGSFIHKDAASMFVSQFSVGRVCFPNTGASSNADDLNRLLSLWIRALRLITVTVSTCFFCKIATINTSYSNLL